MSKTEEKREVVVQQVSVECDVGDAGAGQGRILQWRLWGS